MLYLLKLINKIFNNVIIFYYIIVNLRYMLKFLHIKNKNNVLMTLNDLS